MNKTLVSVLVFTLLLLFIFSPFAVFSGLLLILFFAALSSLFVNIFQVMTGNKKTDTAP
ncbi:MAG: hypothetical protein IGS39_18500 [Calothrix sp. C42_A2020_038]|nr:hypothetical protein [Calothrix sp. C42_A2020_038]